MNRLIINCEDLEWNIQKIRELADRGQAKVIAVVKANGYGLGLLPYVRFLEEKGIDFFATASAEEAETMRKNGVRGQILVLSSVSLGEELEPLLERDIIFTVGSREAGDVLDHLAGERGVPQRVHLKIDTGFGRHGFIDSESDVWLQEVKRWQNLRIEGAFTQFPLSADHNEKHTKRQYERFLNCVEKLRENDIPVRMLHACNSTAAVRFPEMHLDAVRIGSAFLGRLAVRHNLELRKVGYLSSVVEEKKQLPPGWNIGYSGSYRTRSKTQIAIVPCGHSDGFNVQAKRDMFRPVDKLRYVVGDVKAFFKRQGISVVINGQKCKVVGRVGATSFVADVTDRDVSPGDEVVMEINPLFVDSGVERYYV